MMKISAVSQPLALLPFIFINSAFANTKVDEIYKNNCASCHGDSLQGAMAPPLNDQQWLTDGSDKALAKAITNGISGTTMPSFNKSLSDEEIRALVVYIKEAGNQQQSKALPDQKLNQKFKTKKHDVIAKEITNVEGIVWALDFLPDGTLIYTVRQGELWTLSPSGKKTLIKNTPKVWHKIQAGLLDVIPDPNYEKNGWIYLSYSKQQGKNKEGRDTGYTSVVRGKIKNGQWVEQEQLFKADEDNVKNRGWHFGSRFAIQGDYLFFTNGDEGYQEDAQDITLQNGKIHRIYKDGRIPKDNPFYHSKEAQKTIWTYGNRNPQGLAINPDDNLVWSTEHGPRGGDELNLIQKENNYGWPKVTFGINYDGTPITPYTELPGMTPPKHQWTPSIAVAGMNFYTGSQFEHWKGDLFIGSLAKKQLHRVRIKNNIVVEDEIILKGLGRIRDVVTAPNGSIYLTINDRNSNSSKIITLTK